MNECENNPLDGGAVVVDQHSASSTRVPATREDVPGGSTQRLFVSFPVPKSVQDALAQLKTQIHKHLPAKSLSWVAPATFHVTLKFLGDVEVDLIPTLKERLRNNLAEFGSLEVEAHGISWLPTLLRPRVLIAGIAAQTGKLEALQMRVRDATMGVGVTEPDRAYIGHVTLARSRRNARLPPDALATVADCFREATFGSWMVREIQLMASELHSEGAQHTVIGRFPLEVAGIEYSHQLEPSG